MCNHYTEVPEKASPFRSEYRESLKAYIGKRLANAENTRNDFAKDIFSDPEPYRTKLMEMLGAPLTGERTPAKLLRREILGEMDGCEIFRMQFEVLDEVLFTGLLFKRKGDKKRPLIISQHGGVGTPELCSSLYEDGSSNYYEMTRRILKYDVNVFAPQLLLWHEKGNDENDVTSPFRRSADIRLKNLGSSITAIELYELQSCLDYFSMQNYVDTDKLGMVGLSYGGMYTLLMSAIDMRIKAAISCSFFGVFSFTDGTDWSWFNSACTFKDAEIAALCWPRDITLLMGKDDPLFGCAHSEREFERLTALASGRELTEHIRYYSFPGLHEFCRDDKYIEHMMRVMIIPLI